MQSILKSARSVVNGRNLVDNELLPCPMCGSPAKLDYTGVLETYRDWQTGFIACTKTLDEHCGMELLLTMDFWYQRGADQVLTDTWNRLARENTKGKEK
jgi:hypothetical protein